MNYKDFREVAQFGIQIMWKIFRTSDFEMMEINFDKSIFVNDGFHPTLFNISKNARHGQYQLD